MADIELVIKIPDKTFKNLQLFKDGSLSRPEIAVKYGTPLPKGHPELVIKDFKSKINAYDKDYNFSKEEIINILERYELKHNKTIVEADKTESEE